MGNFPKSNERQFIRINILCSYSCPAHLRRAFYFYPCHASDNTNRLRHCKPYLLSRESVAQRQPHSDPGMVSGTPSDGTMVNKETGAEQFRPDNGQMRRPDAQPVAGGQSGQTAPQGQQSTPVSSDRNGKVPPARPQAENSRMSSVKKEVTSAAESAMPSVDVDAPSITAPEVGISVPGTSAPTLDIKAPAVSLPGAEVPVPALKNPF